jgi:hypothetical protein
MTASRSRVEGRPRRFTPRQVGSNQLIDRPSNASFLRVHSKQRIKTAEIPVDQDLVCLSAGRDSVDAEALKAALRQRRAGGARMRLRVASRLRVLRAGKWP